MLDLTQEQKKKNDMSLSNQGTTPSCGEVSPLTQHLKKIRGNSNGAKECGLGALFWGACLADLHSKEGEISAIHQWTQNPKNFIVMMGSQGTGKTYFCAAMLNFLWDRGDEVYFIECSNLFRKLQDGMRQNHCSQSIIKNLCDNDILIIDDIGAGTNTEWQQEMILFLINERYQSMKPTIITTNLDKQEISKQLGFRVSSRLWAKENLIIPRWEKDRRL